MRANFLSNLSPQMLNRPTLQQQHIFPLSYDIGTKQQGPLLHTLLLLIAFYISHLEMSMTVVFNVNIRITKNCFVDG